MDQIPFSTVPGPITAEKCFLSLARSALGVHKKTSLLVLRGELGIFPIGITILKHMFKYLQHISKYNDDSLLGKALAVSKDLHTNNKASWFHSLHLISKMYNVSVYQYVHLFVYYSQMNRCTD